jgi:large subunit ribosomal protein L4
MIMKLDVFEGQKKIKEIELKSLFGEKSEQALYQVVIARQTHDRSGNAFTKTKSEVRGGGKKPWKQKGLGRARAGSSRSPLWRGGGVTFGPKPKDFSKHINKKMKDLAYVTVFSKMADLKRVTVFNDVASKSQKTSDFKKTFKDFLSNEKERLVIILPEYNKGLYLGSRNLQNVTLVYPGNLDILPLVFADRILISEKAAVALDTKFAANAK